MAPRIDQAASDKTLATPIDVATVRRWFGDGGEIAFIDVREDGPQDRKSTRLNSSHIQKSRMPSSA